MSILKKPYEISIWEDRLVRVIDVYNSDGKCIATKSLQAGEKYDSDPQYTTKVHQYYDEKKIAIIGSNTMTAPFRAVNPQFTRNVNGSISLTFTMYSKYYDDETDTLLDNPFTKLMVNERKVKLKYDGEWYDFVIKSIQENSEQYSYSYTASGLFVNELSKNGYQVELDSELGNNIDNINELAKKILEGSDWRLDEDETETFQQYKEEPLYEIILAKDIECNKMYSDEDGDNITSIRGGQKIYGFYQSVNEPNGYFQFLYRKDGEYTVDDDRVITNSPNYYIEYTVGENGTIPFIGNSVISNDYRGRRLVRSQKTTFDPLTDKYVSLYKGPGDKDKNTYYCYSDTKYITSNTVKNYIVNPTAFTDTSGWSIGTTEEKEGETPKYPDITIETIPDVEKIEKIDAQFASYLDIHADTAGQLIRNSCIKENRSSIKQFTKGEKYVIRIKSGMLNDDKEIDYSKNPDFNLCIAKYSLKNGVTTIDEEKYFSIASSSGQWIPEKTGTDTDNPIYEYRYSIITCTKTLSYDDMKNNQIGLFISFPSLSSPIEWYIEDIQFFKYVESNIAINDEGEEEAGATKMVLPGDTIYSDAKTLYYLYLAKDKKFDDKNKKLYSYIGESIPNIYEPIYDDNFEKRRSISGKESNRFNLLQSLCETFECWVKFRVDHDANGKIIIKKEADGSYRQQKWVSFHEYVGKNNYAGFKYGINLKSIQRTLDSNAIANKLIVKSNSNKFADNGFCTIAYAEENPIRESFIYDFSYYTKMGLIDFDELNNDLYLTTNGYIGYYTKLANINKENERYAAEQAELISSVIPNWESQNTTYETAYNSANEVYISNITKLEKQTGFTLDYLFGHKENSWWNDEETKGLIIDILYQKNNMQEYKKLYEIAKKNLARAKKRLEVLDGFVSSNVEKKKELNALFYKKYSRFIQEGTWTSEEYIDPNLYYLDAMSTLHTSCQPKVSYTINVIDVSQIDGYENYNFSVGDKTTMEDTEFFGWGYIDNIKTPNKEEVIISEVKNALDSPEQNQIKVQNYKTQFEDLFQRVAAATTSIQYSSGDYQRAADAVLQNGSIDQDVLQNSFTNNSIILSNSNNESVSMGPQGITTYSVARPNEMVRIVGGGIFLSDDFGSSWNTGITGRGINANYINAGQIDVGKVNIMCGSFPTFRWEAIGLSAYSFKVNESGYLTEYSPSKFIRLDQYGLYAIDGNEAFNATVEEKDEPGVFGTKKIAKHAKFYLTWEGFGIKTNNGAVSITSDNDFQVFDGEKERVKIGFLETKTIDGKDHKTYGLRLKDDGGKTTLETGSNGQLYLKKTILIAPEKYADGARVILGPSQGYNKDGDVVALNGTDLSDLSYSKVFSVSNTDGSETIAIYDNGLLEAQNAKITGEITATSGKIGAMSVDGNSLIVKKEDRPVVEINENGIIAYDAGITIYATTENGEENIPIFVFKDNTLSLSKISLNSASIGNIKIDGTGTGKISVSDTSGNENIVISGNGTIKAKNIEIGESSTISNYIKLGNAYIRNPDKNKNLFINVKAEDTNTIEIYDNGYIKIGSLSFDGNNSTIKATGWSLTPNLAEFQNAVVNGTLKTAIFEKDTVRLSGGAMIFKDSDKIKIEREKDNEGKTIKVIIKLEDEKGSFNCNEGDIIGLSRTGSNGINYYVVNAINMDGSLVIKGDIYSTSNGDPDIITYYGDKNKTTGALNDWIIGVNSTDSQIFNLSKKSISFLSATYKDSKMSFTPEIILGELPSDLPGVNGKPGLYANSVYLKGTLTTEYNGTNGTEYAGVNTLSGVKFNKSGGNSGIEVDESNIIFWAGANGAKDGNIQDAKFQVTSNGTMYATQGFFSGNIVGADIYAANIYPHGDNSALNIYNTGASNGIQFMKRTTITETGENGSKKQTIKDSVTMYINADGLYYTAGKTGKKFIDLGDNGARFIAGAFSLENDGLFYNSTSGETPGKVYGVRMSDNKFCLRHEQSKVDFISYVDKALDFAAEKTTISSNSIRYGETMNYKKVAEGYDLYVGLV